jgi:hypothetical protein
VSSTELIRQVVKRLWRRKLLVLVAGVAISLGLFFYAKTKRPVYTAKATIFPLTNALDNSLSSNTLSGILGLGEATKTFSSEATINIIELSLSRYVRECVANVRMPAFGNKTVADLLIEDQNEHRSPLQQPGKLPRDSIAAAVTGGELLRTCIGAKMTKNGLLELSFTHPKQDLITPVANVLISKVSQFYTDLKIRKAQADYQFTVRKVDSLDAILNGIDRKAISIQNTTLFAPDRLEYDIPKQKVNADKQRFLRQREISLNNQEEALWRLQKSTPIISVLDTPTEPFTISRPSAVLYAAIGFIAGSLFVAFLLVSGLLYHYGVSEFKVALAGDANASG